MHYHGYLWTGSKESYDDEGLRRPPHPQPPPESAGSELAERYRAASEAFFSGALPPTETAYWLVKPRSLVRGSWTDADAAAEWLEGQLAAYALRFAHAAEQDARRREAGVRAAAERLARGGDVSLGHYLRGPAFLSVAVVTCSPNRTHPELPCPRPS